MRHIISAESGDHEKLAIASRQVNNWVIWTGDGRNVNHHKNKCKYDKKIMLFMCYEYFSIILFLLVSLQYLVLKVMGKNT